MAVPIMGMMQRLRKMGKHVKSRGFVRKELIGEFDAVRRRAMKHSRHSYVMSMMVVPMTAQVPRKMASNVKMTVRVLV